MIRSYFYLLNLTLAKTRNDLILILILILFLIFYSYFPGCFLSLHFENSAGFIYIG